MHTDVFDHADQLEPRIITTSGFKSRQSSNIMAANLPLRSENQGLFVLSAHTRCQFFLFIIGIRCQKIYSYDWDRYGRKTGYICRRHCALPGCRTQMCMHVKLDISIFTFNKALPLMSNNLKNMHTIVFWGSGNQSHMLTALPLASVWSEQNKLSSLWFCTKRGSSHINFGTGGPLNDQPRQAQGQGSGVYLHCKLQRRKTFILVQTRQKLFRRAGGFF